ncbi:MAG: anthranilate phosphoribosyltransferase [Parvularculaceae bacterium]
MKIGSAFVEFGDALARAQGGAPLHADEMRAAIGFILRGEADDDQIAEFLSGLADRGETPEEIAAAADAMRAHALKIDAAEDVIDTCGTGGDGADTLNISTAAALIAAGAGARVAKHGNRAVSSKSGSSQALAALGLRLDAPRPVLEKALAEANIAFLYAPQHHPAMKHAAAARAKLGRRTLFNLLGPLANPAGARRQLIGAYGRDLLEPMAEALGRLGAEHVWVVHGADGLDELTTTDKSFVAEWRDGRLSSFEIAPEDVGLARAAPDRLRGGGPDENAAAIARLLGGTEFVAEIAEKYRNGDEKFVEIAQKLTGPALAAYRDIVLLNAAAALIVAGKAADLPAGIARARAALDSGAAMTALRVMIEISNEDFRVND